MLCWHAVKIKKIIQKWSRLCHLFNWYTCNVALTQQCKTYIYNYQGKTWNRHVSVMTFSSLHNVGATDAMSCNNSYTVPQTADNTYAFVTLTVIFLEWLPFHLTIVHNLCIISREAKLFISLTFHHAFFKHPVHSI